MSSYQEKWQQICLSTQRLDRRAVNTAIETAYAAIGKPTPEVLICDSPGTIVSTLIQWLKRQLGQGLSWMVETYSAQQWKEALTDSLGNPCMGKLTELLYWQLRHQLAKQVGWQIQYQIAGTLRSHSYSPLLFEHLCYQSFFPAHLTAYLSDCLSLETWIWDASWMDFGVSVLGCSVAESVWIAFQGLVETCGWLVPYDRVCLVWNRPVQIGFDAENRLHGEGEPALQFIDGFSVYAYQGSWLPPDYGRFHPHQWQPQWLLTEPDPDLRRILIQGMGYGRISQELEHRTLDSWREYSLLEMIDEIDEEPLRLLKMTCPSTGFTHVIRVPPALDSAKEAICWANWNVNPETFAVQS